ncbi:MAG: leucine-rich repeat domain-containing protein [Treponema sp.]|jgi:hypothetical protein|nr:leucine-rich repeat domain-containing protein [Treponema sp.]
MQLDHTITLTGPHGTQTHYLDRGKYSASFSLAPGRWIIEVESRHYGDPYATGTTVIDVKAGSNQATVQMSRHCYHSGTWYGSTATCTTSGFETRDCDVCGINETQPLPALGHNWVWVVYATGNIPLPDEDRGTCFCGVTSTRPSTATEGLNYGFYATGHSITGYSGTDNDIVIPYYFRDNESDEYKPVDIMSYSAFGFLNSLTSIIFPDSLKWLDQWALSGCYGLTSITIPGGMNSFNFSISGHDTGRIGQFRTYYLAKNAGGMYLWNGTEWTGPF